MKKIEFLSKQELKVINGGYSFKEFGADCKRIFCAFIEGMSIGSKMSPTTGVSYPTTK